MGRTAVCGSGSLCPIRGFQLSGRLRMERRKAVILEWFAMASEDEDSEKSLKVLGIVDIGKIPCARESFLCGSLGGIVVGLGHFLATSRVSRSCYIGLGGYVLTTLGFWFHCRYNHAKRRFEQRMIREGMKKMILFEGTQYDPARRATTTEEKRP